MLRHPSLARRRGRGASRPRGAHPAQRRWPSACRASRSSRATAPAALAGLAAPDAVFVGGGGTDPGVLDAAIAAAAARRAAGRERGDAGDAGAARSTPPARLGGDAHDDRGRPRRAGRRHDRLAAGDAGDAVGLGEAVTVAGIGCRRGVTGRRRCWRRSRRRAAAGALDALATVPAKRGEPALAEAARRLGLPLLVGGGRPTPTRGSLSRSAASRAATGSASASEAAALAAAGPAARLVGAAAGARAGHLRHRGRGGPRVTVHFIGAGPGAADLITVRGRDLLARCPVCLYAGSVVPPELLAHCPPGARLRRHRAAVARRDRGGVRRRRTPPGRTWRGCTPATSRSGAPSPSRSRRLDAPRHPLHADAGRPGLRRRGGGARARADHPRGRAEPGADPRLRPRLGDAARARRWRPSAAPARRWRSTSRSTRCRGWSPSSRRSTAPTARWRWSRGRAGPTSAWCAATLGTIEAALAADPIDRTAIILVGRGLAAEGFRDSALYDAGYQRRFRGRAGP